MVPGGEHMRFEFMAKICNCSGKFVIVVFLMMLGVFFQDLAPAYLTDRKPYCKVFS